MKPYIFILFILFSLSELYSFEEPKYPIIYIPGMFDNGDLLTKDNLLVKNTNDKDGFYYKNYFTEKYNYDDYEIFCGSNIVGSKYNRLVVANLIKEIRTNISIFLMSQRLYCLIEGEAPRFKNYYSLTNHKGNDYKGEFIKNGEKIYFYGLRQEIWSKYGNKVYYNVKNNKKTVSYKKTDFFYENDNFYFNDPDDVKFNFITHSSGGLALREYVRLRLVEKKSVPVKNIVNLSVPQKGASMLLGMKKGFKNLIKHSADMFFKNENIKSVKIYSSEKEKIYTYKELIEKTNINLLRGSGKTADFLRGVLTDYILYFIPFDGHKRVLGNDPALYDLHPKHRLVILLNKTPIPENIAIYNYRVNNAYSTLFKNIGRFLNLEKNDGVVDFNDASLELIPGYDKLSITDIEVDRANHIPLPYIKPLFELRETVENYYPVLGALLKKKTNKEESIDTVYALMSAILIETGLDLEFFLENENFSVIDYFAENPVLFY